MDKVLSFLGLADVERIGKAGQIISGSIAAFIIYCAAMVLLRRYGDRTYSGMAYRAIALVLIYILVRIGAFFAAPIFLLWAALLSLFW